jgi:NADH-quinone oxidoreductase subunit N
MTFSAIEFNILLPHILLAGSAILILLIDLLLPSDMKSLNQPLSILFLGITLYFTLNFLWTNPASTTWLFGDGFAVFFIIIFILAAVLVILTSDRYLQRTKINLGEYYALVILATCGASLMASAADLLTLFLGLEIMSISLYVLAGFHRERAKSNESALKYFLLGAFFSGFFLFGIMLIYASGFSLNILYLINNLGSSLPLSFTIGAILVLIAFAFKASLFPFHFWSPDVYDGAPTPISAWMATGAKAAAFAALLRVFFYIFPQMGTNTQAVLWLIAVLTMTTGNVLALAQSNIKRMLAYSSIAHAGYLAVGFLALNETTTPAIMFYLFAYTLMNIGAFTVAHIVNTRGKGEYQLSDFTGIGTKHPFLAVVMAVFLFSLAGIPPTAGFFGKFYLFKSALESGYTYLVIIAVLNSALSVYYYLRVLVYMFMQKETDLAPVRWELPVSTALIICVIGILNFGLFPNLLLNILQYAGI